MKRNDNDRTDDCRAVGYVRVSTREQALPDKPSLATQEERIRCQCAAQEWELVGLYRDVISGSEWARPSLQQLLADAEANMFGRVVVLAIDRLGRDLRDLLEISERLRDLGVHVVSVKESIDTSTAMGRFYFQFLGIFAEFERERIRERTSEGRKDRARSGGFVGSVAAYGYTYELTKREGKQRVGGGILHVRPDHAAVVSDIFQWATEMGAPKIAKRLNEGKVSPPDNAQHPLHRSTHGWHASTVARILADRRYTGEGDYAGSVMHYPPIIEAATFEAAREATEQRKRFRASHPTRTFLLQHIVKCRHCGGACAASLLGRQKLPYYVCCTARRYGAKQHGSKSQWPASKVEPVVQRWVAAFIDNPEAELAKAELSFKQLDEQHAERVRQIRHFSERLKALDVEEQRATTSHVKGLLDESLLAQQLARITRERAEAQAKLDELGKADEARARAIVDHQLVLHAIELMRHRRPEDLAAAEWMTELSIELSPPGEWQDTIRQYVRTVWLNPDGSVSVEGSLPAFASDAISPPS